MTWFKNHQEEKIKLLLRESRQDFRYDHESTRLKLLQNLNHYPQPASHTHVWIMAKYALVAACFVFLFSATLAFTSNAKPGEKLFTLNKWGEQMILRLPLPEEQKMNIENNIVTKRLEALDIVEKENKILETVKESDETLNAAVEKIIINKAKIAVGDDEKTEKLDEALERLDAQAALREQKIKDLEDRVIDQEAKAKIRIHRENFQKTRAKMRLETKAYQERKNLEFESGSEKEPNQD